MNKFILTIVFCILLSASLVSCKKDFLEVVPLGSLIAGTTDDYDQLMNSITFYYYQYGGWDLPCVMGDEAAVEAPFSSGTLNTQQTSAFQWQAVIYQQGSTALDLQFGLQSLYTLNKVIGEVGGSSGGTDSAKTGLQAEAMATRAWLYLQFVNYYAKPYLASTAAADPGFPIITKSDVTLTNYTRGTVQDVYDQMIKDLTAAITSLPVKAKIQTRMSRPAAEGLLGKVYLYMGRYSDAAAQFLAALSDINTIGVPALYDYNVTFGPGGSFLPIDPDYGPADPGNNPNDLYEAVVSKVFNNFYTYSGVVLTPQAAALYGASDWRLQFYSNSNWDGTPNPGGRLRKYGVNYSRIGLQLPDLYLMSAECKARLNDLAGAKADVETLRKSRMPVADAAVPSNIATDQTALIKFIIDERTREFALEGYRWFDMRRLSVDPLFAGQPYTHTLYNDDAGNSTTMYTLDQPNRWTFQLPPDIMAANPNMQNNP